MRRVLIGAALLAVLLAIPAISSAGKGQLIAKDVGKKGNSLTAVALARVQNPGVLRGVISTKPRRMKVDWIYTTDCYKNDRKHSFPKPGTRRTRTDRSTIRTPMKKAVANPDYCDVGISGKLGHKKGKKIVAKIFHKR